MKTNFLNLTKLVLKQLYWNYISFSNKKKYGYYGNNVYIVPPCYWGYTPNVFLFDNVILNGNVKGIMSEKGGKFIMKSHSGAATGLTIITNAHPIKTHIGDFKRSSWETGSVNKDIIIEEDVWIASNVTILAGVTVGRGAVIGAGSVLRQSIPPYAVVYGNPAKVVGFIFTPEEIIEHEKFLYEEDERLPLDFLTKNYNKYYKERIKEILAFTNLKA